MKKLVMKFQRQRSTVNVSSKDGKVQQSMMLSPQLQDLFKGRMKMYRFCKMDSNENVIIGPETKGCF